MKNDRNDWSIHAISGAMCVTDHGSDQVVRIRENTGGPTVFVVSPLGQETGSLTSLIDDAIDHDDTIWAKLENRFEAWSDTIEGLAGSSEQVELHQELKEGFDQIEDILKAVWLIRDASMASRKYVDAIELSWVLSSLKRRFEQAGHSVVVADSARIFSGTIDESGIRFDYQASLERLQEQIAEHGECDTICISGGWVSDRSAKLLDNGNTDSELIASACGYLLEAKEITFWNEDEFLTTADKAEVPGAVVIGEITYAEATELSFFGAKVLHPHAFVPAIAKQIPIRLRCFRDITHPGTLVLPQRAEADNQQVKGFSAIHGTALINIEGAGMIGVPGVSSRLFTAMRESRISVILISQASSEHSICFAVPAKDAELAAATARRVFAEELDSYRINSIEVESDCAILAAVGEQMPGVPGIAAKFFGALGKAHVNVRAIAQGSSERNISAVIRSSDATKALRALHAGFFLSRQTLSIGLIGPGLIGSTLLKQIAAESERLKSEFNVDLRVRGIANSRKMLLSEQGIDLSSWEQALDSVGEPADLERFAGHVAADYFPHSVLIDCSTSSVVPAQYKGWIERGIHLITPNKKAGTFPYPQYEELMTVGRRHGKHFLYETTVGAGLPIIGTLKDLIQTGDTIRRIEGVFSGTLAYLFWRFDGTVPFSQLVREAKELGYTEPDPRDDLTGMDIVRKAVILSREIGMRPEIEEVPVRNLVPEQLNDVPIAEFLEQLPMIDEELLSMQQEAASEGKLLKYVGIIEPSQGTCRVELKGYPKDHPFARISGTDNIVAFTTDRYHQQPLVIQGPGAGPEVTAGGVFADLLRLGAYLGARF